MAIREATKPRPGTPIQNRNFLSPVGFKFALKRSPKMAFFCIQANIISKNLKIYSIKFKYFTHFTKIQF